MSWHMGGVSKAVEFVSHNYEKFLMIADFNAQAIDYSVKSFCDIYSLNHVVNESTYFKNPVNPE